MRVLVTGADGMLGFALRESRPAEVELLATDLATLDVTDAGAVERQVQALAPDAVLNAAAFTDVDGCETREELALSVNGAGAGHLAAACERAAIPLLHVSTDYVFDGRLPAPGQYAEHDATNPLSAYGRTKLAGERAVAAATPRHWIVRTQWLYGAGGRNFVETMLRLGAERPRLTVVDDQVGCPTSTHDLAPLLWEVLLRRPAFGIYHAANAGQCSWYGFARAIFERAGLGVEVAPIDTATLGRPAPRPARSVLNTSKLRAALGVQIAPWEDALQRYLQRRAAATGATR